MSDLLRRLEKYVDVIYIDEVQDVGGHDFELLMAICGCNVDQMLVGDFHQHTFDTSRDGATNRTLHDDYERYKKRFKEVGLVVDTTSLAKSHRCSQAVCRFIREHLGIEIFSHTNKSTDVIFLERQEDVDRVHACEEMVKLFYQEHRKYGCNSENWGNSKGTDHYQDVCVVLNGTACKAFKGGVLRKVNPQTRNKLYVACSRTRGNLYLVSDQMFKKFKSA
jgi:DNA helicase-2/ATP-dependent DNA helicase PcrA